MSTRGWTVYVDRARKKWRCRWEGKYGTGQNVFVFKTDAQEFALDKRRDFERMSAGLPPARRAVTAITVSEWWKRYSKTKARENPETFRRFDTPALKPFVEKHGQIVMAALDDAMVQDYKHALEDKYTGDTPRMYYQQVCAFLNAAVRAGVLLMSPAKGVAKPAPGGGGGRPLTAAEISFLIPDAPEPLYRTGIFSMNTRLRINEVLILDWRWVSEIELPGGQGWMGRIPAELRKTRSKVVEDCVFAINAAARAVMGERRESGRVFAYSATTIQHQVMRRRREMRLPEDITFHCFRHTGASLYLSGEGPDGGHMEDLLKTHVWDDPRSLLRYVRPSPATLWRRASAAQITVPTPPLPPKGKGPSSS